MKKIIIKHKNYKYIRSKILQSRENQYKKILKYLKGEKENTEFIIISISLNIKGFPKYNFSFLESLKYIINFFESYFGHNNIISYKTITGISGEFLLIKIKAEPMVTKYITYNLEKKFRFLDIDIYTKNSMISSSLICLKKKRCIICNDEYDICQYKKRHTVRQLRKKVNQSIKDFLLNFNKKFS
ncbi:MAG: citrate lyase holo-[acyl-carrier protein] synthase [Exilispira sp.]|jgi:phosphoribosyl-dephospho-CoA transferase|nr:citrate lyase holo-[acyl-carrier protein] synthase [Exilispira sp.]